MLHHPLLADGQKFNPARVSASAWFDGSADSLSKTFGGAGNSDRLIISLWARRTEFGAVNPLVAAAGDSNNRFEIRFHSDDTLLVLNYVSGVEVMQLNTSAVYRDTGWYHIVFSYEDGDGQLYVNGEEPAYQTEDQSSAGVDCNWNKATLHEIGKRTQTSATYYDGYLAQVTSLDGVSIQNGDYAITDLGQAFVAGANGTIWTPRPDSVLAGYATTAGGNSFCLTSEIGDGADANDNNNFTANNMSHAANGSESTPSLSYPILTPLNPDRGSHTLSDGNLTVISTGTAAWSFTDMTFPASGHHYAEFVVLSSLSSTNMGVFVMSTEGVSSLSGPSASADSYGYCTNGTIRNNNTNTTYGGSCSSASVISFVMNEGALNYWLDGVDQGEVVSGLAGDFVLGVFDGSSNNITGTFRFAESAWTETPPTGAKPINSANRDTPSYQGCDYFNAVTYTGDGVAIGSGGHAITGMGFQPDIVFAKERGAVNDSQWYDRLTGRHEQLQPNENTAAVNLTEGLSAFDADGFTTGSHEEINNDTDTYIAFGWKAGDTDVANDEGSISIMLSISQAGHLSLVRYSGTGSAETINHGLAERPDLVIVKDITGAFSWQVWSPFLSSTLHYLNINTNAGESNASGAQRWNDTAPTSSVVTVGTASCASGRDYVMASFRSVPDVCLVSAYTANLDADGPYVPCGFKPRWLLTKRLDGTGHEWHVYDTERSPTNPVDKYLFLDQTAAESTGKGVDFLSSGFKIRTADADVNSNGNTHIFIAMADVAGGGDLPPVPGA
ncbi:MAG: LamG-like jellyroll fold domain-containing protein [Alphaproteobacteria bacterium]